MRGCSAGSDSISIGLETESCSRCPSFRGVCFARKKAQAVIRSSLPRNRKRVGREHSRSENRRRTKAGRCAHVGSPQPFQYDT